MKERVKNLGAMSLSLSIKGMIYKGVIVHTGEERARQEDIFGEKCIINPSASPHTGGDTSFVSAGQ